MSAPMSWLLYGETPRCGCTGQCGRTHESGGCAVTHPSALTVAPADAAQTAVTPLSLPAEAMRVWCADCHAMAAAITSSRRRLRVLVEATCHKTRETGALSSQKRPDTATEAAA